jgi:hypothetical protein
MDILFERTTHSIAFNNTYSFIFKNAYNDVVFKVELSSTAPFVEIAQDLFSIKQSNKRGK